MKKDMSDLLQILLAVGLDKREAAFYLAALQLGKGLVSKVALLANLNRSASYDVVRSLRSKGLLSTVKASAGLMIVPVDPSQLLHMQQSRLELVSQHLNELRYLFTVAQREPGVKMFEGLEGMRRVLQMELDEARDISIFGDGDAFRRAVPGWSEDAAAKRVRRGIRSRLLLRATLVAVEAAKKLKVSKGEKARLTMIRVLPEALGISGGFDIFNDKVVLFSFDHKNIAVVIESKVIAAMMLSVFNMLWAMAETYDATLVR